MANEIKVKVTITEKHFNAIKKGLSLVSQHTTDRDFLEEIADALGDLSYQFTKNK